MIIKYKNFDGVFNPIFWYSLDNEHRFYLVMFGEVELEYNKIDGFYVIKKIVSIDDFAIYDSVFEKMEDLPGEDFKRAKRDFEEYYQDLVLYIENIGG